MEKPTNPPRAFAIHINKTGRTLFENAADAYIGDSTFMNCEIVRGNVMRLRPTDTKTKDSRPIYDDKGRSFITPPKSLRERLGFDGSRSYDVEATYGDGAFEFRLS